ncbi:polysaccharide deacetylase family protein [Bacillus sp. FJAT-22090]|uniref:polysaccharide deacetylase family protein n=1 Tax=Bacillus sp. FJAT-22090 TaxID=1581038 RepID=UPI0011A486A8|nr:polysaccharide deacetylase family protein [Bacillus sp. FJAT-22090]
MWKYHLFGIVLATFVISMGFFYQPFSAQAKEIHWGFKKTTNEIPPEAGAELDTMLEKHGAIYKGDPNEKIIYFTFDNGYENGYTESILDTLKKENIKATFFLTGHYLESATPLVKRMIAEGHQIGNHSYGHPNLARLSKEGVQQELQKFDQKLSELTSVKRTTVTRPPEGSFNEQVLEAANEIGYQHIFWSVAFIDWHRDQKKGGQYAYDQLISQIHPGAIILMHTVSPDNAEGLPMFIKEARKRGYTFGTLDELNMNNQDIPLSFLPQ